jgi:hypothetical protein
MSVSKAIEGVRQRTNFGMQLIRTFRFVDNMKGRTFDQVVENPQTSEEEEQARNVEFWQENLQLEGLTPTEVSVFMERGSTFGYEYAKRVRAEKAGEPLESEDPYEVAQAMLAELREMPLDQKIYLCNITVEKAIYALECGSYFGLKLVETHMLVKEMMALDGRETNLGPMHPFEEEIAELIETLGDIPGGGRFRKEPLWKTIESLRERNKKGMEILKQHLAVIGKTRGR